MAKQSKELAPQVKQQTLKDVLLANKTRIQAVAARGMDAEKMVRLVCMIASRDQNLAKCTPMSVLRSVMDAAALGLTIGGPLAQSYLVPYYNKHIGQHEAQWQLGYRGMIELVTRPGKITHISYSIVYENDEFVEVRGTEPSILHRPDHEKPGRKIGVYAVAHFAGSNARPFVYLSAQEIEAIKSQFVRGLERSDSPWRTSEEAMWVKTAIRRLCKTLPITSDVNYAIERDEMGTGIEIEDAIEGVDDAPPAESRTEELEQIIEAESSGEEERAPEGADEFALH